MSRRLVAVALGLVFAAGLACSSDPNRPPPRADSPSSPPTPALASGGGDGGAGDASSGSDAGPIDAGPCNAIALSTVIVDQYNITGDPVAGVGGAITDGTYDLNAASVFVGAGVPGPSGTSFRQSLVVSGLTMQRAQIEQTANGSRETRSSFTYAMNGTNLVLAQTCDAYGLTETWSYTMAGTTLTLTGLTNRRQFVYTRK